MALCKDLAFTGTQTCDFSHIPYDNNNYQRGRVIYSLAEWAFVCALCTVSLMHDQS